MNYIRKLFLLPALIVFAHFILLLPACNTANTEVVSKLQVKETLDSNKATELQDALIDTVEYTRRIIDMSNGDTTGRWPVKAPYPKAGAILPFYRVIAYYGNLYSKNMGILGELPEKQMLERLQQEVKKWTDADSTTPAIPALHYIATTAQGQPLKEGLYTQRMPFAQIDTVLRMAETIKALVFLDIQVGLSTVQKEVPMLDEYLKMPNVHFGVDPEFSMKTGARPGTVIGSFNAEDINFVIDHLAKLVEENNLPPKILIIHRFTQGMVKNYKDIKKVPQVQVVMDMDGWGTKPKKINTYKQFIYPEPVQFTGFKIFYKNDTKRVGASREMQPEDLLSLTPKPLYIQYQ
jgi:hypothetical protein